MNGRPTRSIVLIGVIVLGACSSPNATEPPASSQPAAPDVAPLVWDTCDDPQLPDGECATLHVPVDIGSPDGPSVGIALYRVRATAERIGVLVVNPGGPGVSGVDYVRDAAGLFPASFDVIGFDPRGVGRSEAIECVTDRDLDRWYAAPTLARDDTERARWLDEAAAVASRCSASELGQAIGTVDVARDIDRLRAALGEEQINYVGFSYGARLGWTYATMFPTRVRAMVLDGPEDPASGFGQTTVQQASADQQVLEQFVAFCAEAPGRCPPDPAAAIVDVIGRADVEPLATRPELQPLSGTYALNAVLTAFYDERSWPDLGAALTAALHGDGTQMLSLSFFWSDRHDPNPSVTIDAQELISCADRAERVSVADLADVRRRVERVSPTFAAWLPGSVPPCFGYPPATDPTPDPGSVDVPPILVVSSTGDIATPLAGAQHLVDALGNATLLVRDGPGHTSYGQNLCIDGYVSSYLTDLTLPTPATICR